MDLFPETNTRQPSITHICIIRSISVVSGHVVGLSVISGKFKAALKILLLGATC